MLTGTSTIYFLAAPFYISKKNITTTQRDITCNKKNKCQQETKCNKKTCVTLMDVGVCGFIRRSSEAEEYERAQEKRRYHNHEAVISRERRLVQQVLVVPRVEDLLLHISRHSNALFVLLQAIQQMS